MYHKNILVNCMVRRSGTEVFAIEMTRGLINNGCNVYAIVPRAIENLDDWNKIGLKKLVVINSYTTGKELLINSIKLFLGDYKKTKKQFSGIRIDAVYVSMLNLWSGIINSMFPNAVKYITLHDPIAHSGANKLRTFIDESTAQKADYIIILTNTFREHVKKKYKLKDNRVLYIPHGNYAFYKNYKQERPYRYKGRINYLFFGRIEKYKGIGILAEAYRKLCTRYKDISLTIAGNGDFSEFASQYQSLENVDLQIRWIKDEEVGAFFSADNVIIVLPYLDATQSGVVPIAMEYGCPIIATNTGGLSEQVINGYTGTLVHPNDIDALYQAMADLYVDRNKREMYAANGIKELKKLDWNVLSNQLAMYIESGTKN